VLIFAEMVAEAGDAMVGAAVPEDEDAVAVMISKISDGMSVSLSCCACAKRLID